MTILNFLFVLSLGACVGVYLDRLLLKAMWHHSKDSIREKLVTVMVDDQTEQVWMSEEDKAELRVQIEEALKRMDEVHDGR